MNELENRQRAVLDAAVAALRERHPEAEEQAIGRLTEGDVRIAVIAPGDIEALNLEVDYESLVRQIAAVSIVAVVAASMVAVWLELVWWQAMLFAAVAIAPALIIWNFVVGRAWAREGVVAAVTEAWSLDADEAWIAVEREMYAQLEDDLELRHAAEREGVGVMIVEANDAEVVVEARRDD